jgi:ADP-ribosylglycohydrolase
MTTSSYRECVLAAVNLGEDTDTVAAVAGGLAGIYYGVGGEKGIPQEWIEQIARKEWIKELCENLND